MRFGQFNDADCSVATDMALRVGQHLRRRTPDAQDPNWNEVVIRGFSAGGDLVEPVISGLGFTECISVDPGALLKHYAFAAGDDPAADISEGLEKLNATPWESEPGEPING